MGARLLARTVRGIEELVADEIRSRGLGTVDRIRHREVHLTAVDPAAVLTTLSTADDVLLLGALVDGIDRTRGALDRLQCGLRRIDARGLVAARRRLAGGAPLRTGIDVSASFVGRRAFSRYDVEDAVGRCLAAKLGTVYHSRRGGVRPPDGTCSWRVTIDGETASIALRVADRPAHRRHYKRASVPGTLHPPLAAAMVRLAAACGGHTVLDPCAGAGTLLVEAHRAVPDARLLGADLDAAALDAARANTSGVPAMVLRADAGRLPLAAASVDRILVNPPWNRQVPPGGALAADAGALWAEARRVLRPGGRLVALVHGDAGIGLPVTATWRVRVAGAEARIVVADV